jgi:RNA polymerase sigma-70 factor, ECF subfamily
MNTQTMGQAIVDYYDTLYSVAFNLTRDSHKAKDLVQTTAEKAIKASDSFIEGNLVGWLVTILRNTFRNDYRAEDRISFSSIEELIEKGTTAEDSLRDSQEDSEQGSDSSFSSRFSTASAESVFLSGGYSPELASALQNISKAHRDILLLKAEGYSYEEIAETLNVGVGTVMSRLSRARKAIKGVL